MRNEKIREMMGAEQTIEDIQKKLVWFGDVKQMTGEVV